jgi:Cu(I)/Ag(I) efflux system protein CusF
MKSQSIFGAAFAIALFTTHPTQAMDNMEMRAEQPANAHKIEGQGTVVSVNAVSGNLVLRHEPIKALEWPAMTMGFKVSDKSKLAKLKKGDKVKFLLEKAGEEYVVTDIR